MKRYLLFAGHNYYPSGGWDDFVDSFDDVGSAEAAARLSCAPSSGRGCEWFHIIDGQTGEMVVDR